MENTEVLDTELVAEENQPEDYSYTCGETKDEEINGSGEEKQQDYNNKRKEEMTQVVDLNSLGGNAGGMFGGDNGGGLVAGLLLGQLFNRRDDRNGGEGCVTPSNLIDVSILNKLGSIEGAIPAQTAELTANMLNQTISTNQGFSALALGLSQGLSAVKDSVQTTGVVNLLATKDLAAQGAAQTGQILAAIKQSELDAANRALDIALNRITALEIQGSADNRAHGVEINMTNNQNQVSQQVQVLANGLNTLAHRVECVHQEARATNANLIIGSTGVATGAQTANPVNVAA